MTGPVTTEAGDGRPTDEKINPDTSLKVSDEKLLSVEKEALRGLVMLLGFRFLRDELGEQSLKARDAGYLDARGQPCDNMTLALVGDEFIRGQLRKDLLKKKPELRQGERAQEVSWHDTNNYLEMLGRRVGLDRLILLSEEQKFVFCGSRWDAIDEAKKEAASRKKSSPDQVPRRRKQKNTEPELIPVAGKLIADAVEAVIGAVLVDRGYDIAFGRLAMAAFDLFPQEKGSQHGGVATSRLMEKEDYIWVDVEPDRVIEKPRVMSPTTYKSQMSWETEEEEEIREQDEEERCAWHSKGWWVPVTQVI